MTELIALVVGVLLGGGLVRWRWPRWAVEYVDRPYTVYVDAPAAITTGPPATAPPVTAPPPAAPPTVAFAQVRPIAVRPQ